MTSICEFFVRAQVVPGNLTVYLAHPRYPNLDLHDLNDDR